MWRRRTRSLATRQRGSRYPGSGLGEASRSRIFLVGLCEGEREGEQQPTAPGHRRHVVQLEAHGLLAAQQDGSVVEHIRCNAHVRDRQVQADDDLHAGTLGDAEQTYYLHGAQLRVGKTRACSGDPDSHGDAVSLLDLADAHRVQREGRECGSLRSQATVTGIPPVFHRLNVRAFVRADDHIPEVDGVARYVEVFNARPRDRRSAACLCRSGNVDGGAIDPVPAAARLLMAVPTRPGGLRARGTGRGTTVPPADSRIPTASASPSSTAPSCPLASPRWPPSEALAGKGDLRLPCRAALAGEPCYNVCRKKCTHCLTLDLYVERHRWERDGHGSSREGGCG